MTWTKLGAEFGDECFKADLSDAAFRTHAEAINWIYRVEQDSLRIPERQLRHFAGSDDYQKAVAELLDARFWRERADGYELVHHADVVRQSLAAQRAKRESDKARQRRHRAKSAKAGPDVTRDVTPDVTADVTRDIASTQSVSQKRFPGTEGG